jgi:hypothetical protein
VAAAALLDRWVDVALWLSSAEEVLEHRGLRERHHQAGLRRWAMAAVDVWLAAYGVGTTA